MSVNVIHIISSLKRGGRERQLAGILRHDETLSASKAIVFNRSEISYENEYGLTDKLIYLGNKNPLKRFFEIIRILKNEKPSLVWTWGGMEATYGLILPVFTSVKHINGSIRHGIVLKNTKHQWRKFILKLSRYVVANSKAGLKANGIKKGYVLYNGLDNSFFNQREINPEWKDVPEFNESRKTDNPVLVSVANLVPYKDYSTILKALEILKMKGFSFTYLVVGEGPERKKTEQEIKSRGLSEYATLMGRRVDVNTILSNCDILVHSSRGEGCSNAILEAMACGLTVVASATGGTIEIVHEPHGLLFNFGDEKQLSVHLEYLLSNPATLAEMKINAKNYASENFSMQRMMHNYNLIVETVMNS